MEIMVRIGFFVYYHIDLHGLFIAKDIFIEEQQWHSLTRYWKDKEVHAFLKSISPKVIIIARLEFELSYYNVTGHGWVRVSLGAPFIWPCATSKQKA